LGSIRIQQKQFNNSNRIGGANPQIRNNTGNVPMTKSGYFIWGIVLLIAAIVSLVIIANDYKGV
jgi:hypothetical protein